MEGISVILSLIIGCIVFIFYTNSVFQARKTYLYSNIIIVIGYALLYIVSLSYIPNINAIAFFVVTAAIICLCFQSTFKNAVLHAFILSAIMMLSEGIIFMFTNIGVYKNSLLDVSLSVRIIHAVLSKLIYFIGVIISKYIASDKSKYETTEGFLGLMIIPVFTIMSIVAVMSIFEYIDERQRAAFALVSVFGIASNMIVYWVYDKTLRYNQEIKELQEQKYKNNLELTYCNLLEENLSQIKIMRHDFKEHLRILETYLSTDKNKALEYLQSIQMQNEEISIVNYTSSRVLNILFSEKRKICLENGITVKIHSTNINIDFIKDIDIVSIFSNLLNNAIESCNKSEKKMIYINLYDLNDAFLVIKIENSCDTAPKKEKGFYKTTKPAGDEHGIGLRSVSKSLKNYGGDLKTQYDETEKIFSTIIMVPIS